MQPLAELTLTRPWRWGIAVVGSPAAEVPTVSDGQVVTAGQDVVVLSLRHAADIEVERFEPEVDWAVQATATLSVRCLEREEPTDRLVLSDTVVTTPNGTISLWDADGTVVITAPSHRVRLIISTDDVDPTGLDRVWVDLVAAND